MFCEIAGRWGGGGIRAGFYHRTGVDIISAMLQAQLGEPMPVPSREGDDLTGYTLIYASGERMRRDFHLNEPWVIQCNLRVRAGDVPKVPTAWDRSIAAITVRGETEDQVAERLAACEEAFQSCFR
ncbi:hypothetical protein GCM10010249_60530 [Streptomyces roseolilacinus]|uniref:Uncharacterized protein n=1 Tax=Streptomyces roseolilacinus TaxID=66904 RepID=A0A918EML2_9ACTN|nr:hypothetical protein GCM10010249_60530 [Streptomyces roseolilacinus]